MSEQQENKVQPNWTWLMNNKFAFLGFGFGSGLASKAPGTVGSFVGMLLAGLFLGLGWGHFALFIFSIMLFFLGIWICDETELALGRVHDYKGVVWDEIVAMLLIYSLIPQGFFWWVVAFAVFRFFDIVKPQPIRCLDQRYQNGFGVMIDDIAAAVYTIVVMQLLNVVF